MLNLPMAIVYLQGFANCTLIVGGLVVTDHRASRPSVMEQVSKFGLGLGKSSSYGTFLSMTFPRSLSTSEMAQYVAYYFKWDRRRALCLSYELAVVEEAALCFEVPKLTQVIFYAMLLNEAERLGVLHGQTLHIMELALIGLRWSTFEAWNRDRVLEAQFREEAEQKEESLDAEGTTSSLNDDKQEENKREMKREGAFHAPFIMVFPPLYDTIEMINFVRESFRWHCRNTTRLPCSLSDNYYDLCPRFTLCDAERAAFDFELPEMVQVTFYAVLLTDAVELGIVSGFIAVDLKLTLEGLRWTCFESWLSRSSRDLLKAQLRHTELVVEYVRDTFWWLLREASALRPNLLPMDYHGRCPGFYLGVTTQYAQNSNIPEMVQAIFYAMVMNDTAELGLTSRLSTECMMWVMQQLNWNPIEFWEVSYPWEIILDDFIIDFYVRRMAKTKSTFCMRSPDELLAKGTQGNPCSAPSSSKLVVEVASTSTSSSLSGTSSYSSDGSSRGSSSEGALTSSSSREGSSISGRSVLKKRGRTPVGPIPEIVAEGPKFPGAPARLDHQDGPGSHFPNAKVAPTLKRTALEKKNILPAGYTFVIPDADATVNEPPAKYAVVYCVALNCGLRLPLHPVIEDILNKPGYMTAIDKKSKVKHWKCDFLFVRRESAWGNIPEWNDGKPVKNPFRAPTAEEKKTARYFYYFIWEDDGPLPIPKFMRIEDLPDETADSAPTNVGEKGGDQSTSPHRARGWSTEDRTPGLREPAGTPKIVRAASQDLAALDTSEPFKATEDEAKTKGQDPQEKEFIPPGDGDGPEDKATNPLDVDAETPEDEDPENSGGLDR
ncbi:LOW QUALITY PROTEIN: hypothetical protein Cgig2_020753 [Carnegiea gigantea]|uniref:Uncharacterized protein n=1 Tax=Carnegiea gigantea TaxID=171969 RepID=A0A9Q1JI84_9CARY|nr:LOW QUALITY PROTEIN: hypothetical protein Cgig2_020753 [Carnegiea gigantea]